MRSSNRIARPAERVVDGTRDEDEMRSRLRGFRQQRGGRQSAMEDLSMHNRLRSIHDDESSNGEVDAKGGCGEKQGQWKCEVVNNLADSAVIMTILRVLRRVSGTEPERPVRLNAIPPQQQCLDC